MSNLLGLAHPSFVYGPELRGALISLTRDSWDTQPNDDLSCSDTSSDRSSIESQVMSFGLVSEDELLF